MLAVCFVHYESPKGGYLVLHFSTRPQNPCRNPGLENSDLVFAYYSGNRVEIFFYDPVNDESLYNIKLFHM